VSWSQSQLLRSADEGRWRREGDVTHRLAGRDILDGRLDGGFEGGGVVLKIRRDQCLVDTEGT